MIRKMVIISLFLLLGSPAWAADYSAALMPSASAKDIVSMDVKTSKPHSYSSTNIQRVNFGDVPEYVITVEGEGKYDEYENIVWIKKATAFERDGMLYTKESTVTVRTRNGLILVEKRFFYDYLSEMVTFQRLNANGKVLYEKDYPIRGPICDYTTLPYFLKVFAKNHGKSRERDMYLLSTEPKLYQIKIKDRREETLKLPIGEFQAVKLQLMDGFLGPVLTDITAMFLPKTYLWYSAEAPHHWLQYEGPDSFPNSERIRSYIVKHQPIIKEK